MKNQFEKNREPIEKIDRTLSQLIKTLHLSKEEVQLAYTKALIPNDLGLETKIRSRENNQSIQEFSEILKNKMKDGDYPITRIFEILTEIEDQK